MEKLYRLVKAAGMSFEAYGSRIGIRVSTQEPLEAVQAYLPPNWAPTSDLVVDRLYSFLWARGPERRGVRRFHTLYAGLQNLARSERAEDLFEAFEWDLSAHLAQTVSDRYFVHAGVVGWQGHAIVIPGPSFSGKTTLVKEFLQRGATYYSDEFAVIDRRGRAHAFPRRLGLRSPDGSKQARLASSEFGSPVGSEPLPVAFVLIAHYQASACWRPRVLSQAKGVLALLANTLAARARPAGAMAAMQKAVCRAQVLQGKRGEAAETADSVLNLLSERLRPSSAKLTEVA